MLRYKNSSAIGVLLLIISCSIIKDSDVTSLDQLNKLKLSSIDIVQDLSGTVSTGKAVVTDSIYGTPATAGVFIDINNLITGSVTKQTSITWPLFTKTKMLFRSKITSTGIVIKNYFYQNGAPRSCTVYQNRQLKEWYSFYYNNSWKLTNIRSRIYSSVPTADTTIYRDSLIYNSSGYISSMVRKSPTTPSKVAMINFTYQQYGSNSSLQLGGTTFSYSGYNYFYSNCNCPNNSGNACSGADAQVSNLSARFIATGAQLSSIVTQLKIDDIKNTGGNCGGSGGPSDYDTYYYHPLMLLRGSFTHGDILLNIYAIDWWQPGGQISSNPSSNQNVTFNFNYVR